MARCRLALVLLAGALLAASAEELVWGKTVSKGVCDIPMHRGGETDHLMHYVCNIAAWFRRERCTESGMLDTSHTGACLPACPAGRMCMSLAACLGCCP